MKDNYGTKTPLLFGPCMVKQIKESFDLCFVEDKISKFD